MNPLAREEYEEEKARLEELATQRQDLEASLAEIEKLRDELAETVQRRFDETFERVAQNFEEVSATLFPGGEGRLRLVALDEEGESGEAEGGIEIELRPAGKKITRLTLLSGGEKALGAISFLFALFLAKPCPFYLLDEVEAALDDANVSRFVELLRRYADRAQFIVITHQKRTMEAATFSTASRWDQTASPRSSPGGCRSTRRSRFRPSRLDYGSGVSRTWSELFGDEPNAADESERTGFFGRLRDSLAKSRRALTGEIVAGTFDADDEEAWERLEEALIHGDVGVRATAEIVRRLEARGEMGDLGEALAEEIEELFGGRRRRSRSASSRR